MNAASAIGAAAATLALLVSGCRADPGAVQEVTIELATSEHWEREGFVELVPSIRLPSSVDERDRIEVWLRLPPEGAIETRWIAAQSRHVIAMPPGTRADRVELYAPEGGGVPRVVDVRGTELGPGGEERFHVLRRDGAELRGFAWQRGDLDAQREADQRLGDLVRRTARGRGDVERTVARLQALNDCARCHQASKEESRLAGERSLPNRATDASGLYHVLAVLRSEAPLEASRPRDMNVGDPHVRISCGSAIDAAAPIVYAPAGGARAVRCADGTPPRAVLDVAAALRDGDARVNQVCAARRVLFERLDALGREVFAESFRECGLP